MKNYRLVTGDAASNDVDGAVLVSGTWEDGKASYIIESETSNILTAEHHYTELKASAEYYDQKAMILICERVLLVIQNHKWEGDNYKLYLEV